MESNRRGGEKESALKIVNRNRMLGIRIHHDVFPLPATCKIPIGKSCEVCFCRSSMEMNGRRALSS